MYDELEVKRNALHNKLRQANSPADRGMIRSEMTNIEKDKSILNAEFELFPNLVVPRSTAVYASGRGHGCGHGITGGCGHRGNKSVSTGERAPMQAPKKYTHKDIPKFTVDNQGYRNSHSQKEHKRTMLRLTRLFRSAKMFTDEAEKKFRLHQQNARSQQQNAQHQINMQANRQANEARQVANEESAPDEGLAQEQCNKRVQEASI